MKPAPFRYRRPGSLEEAVALLAGESGAKVLAGGQSLVPLLSMRLAAPDLLVDINGVPGLDRIEVTGQGEGAGVRIGALVRHAAVLAHEEAGRVQPLLAKALANVAHATIRNRGTTVGSLVHADAAAELPAVLALLGGSVEATSPSGTRTIAAEELYVGPMESSLRPDEVAVSAFFPALPADTGVGFEEVARRHGDYAMCGTAALVRVQEGRLVEARAGYLSVADVPTVVDLTESLTEGLGEAAGGRNRGIDDEALARAGERALAELEPGTDIHASADYRAQLVRVLTARVLRQAYDDAVAREARTA